MCIGFHDFVDILAIRLWVVFYGIWWNAQDYVHVFMFFLYDRFFVVVYDYSGGSRVFFDGHSCPMHGFYGVVVVWRWAQPMPVHFDDFAHLHEPKIRSRLCGELDCVRSPMSRLIV